MPVDVIEELKDLAPTLSALAPAIRQDELRTPATHGTFAHDQPDTVLSLASRPVPRSSRPRLIGAAAAVAVAVGAGIALTYLAGTPASSTVPGAQGEPAGRPSVDSPPDSNVENPAPITTLISPEEFLPAGATMRTTKVLPGLAVLQYYDTSDGAQVCLHATFVDGSLVNGCDDRSTVQTGQAYALVGYGSQQLLYGLTATGIGFRVELAGTIITADADGFWWTIPPGDVDEFTIITDDGSTVIPIFGLDVLGPQTTVVVDP